MIGLLSIGLVLHFLAIGLLVGTYVRNIRMPVIASVFAYFFVFHVALGLVLGAYPELIDPR
jgi:hypothetical protein